MNLAPQKGLRSVYSWDEVCAMAGLRKSQLMGRVHRGQLVKRYKGSFPFDQKDVNDFLARLNTGRIQ